jgi:hypothetical protein
MTTGSLSWAKAQGAVNNANKKAITNEFINFTISAPCKLKKSSTEHLNPRVDFLQLG